MQYGGKQMCKLYIIQGPNGLYLRWDTELREWLYVNAYTQASILSLERAREVMELGDKLFILKLEEVL